MSEERDKGREGNGVSPERGERQLKLLIGRLAALVGVVVALFGVISVFTAQTAAVADISGGAVALGLGLIGRAFGSRSLGLAAAILGALAILLSLAAASGIIPGLPGGDHNLFQGPRGDPEP